MKTGFHLIIAAMFLALIAAGCTEEARIGGKSLPLAFQTDFEDANLDRWQPTDPNAWRIDEVDAGKVLTLHQQSKYSPPVRSPLNINLIKDLSAGSFILELKMHSTTRDYGHRDMCLFFGHQDPSHFHYVHIANVSDPHANSIFIVNGEPRVSIAETRTEGTKWDENWHTVRIVRDVDAGTIEVFFDDNADPIMTAANDAFKSGAIGVGSFDDTGQYDDIKIWATAAPK